MVRCPECGADSGVMETRETVSGLRRRRKCTAGHRFTTYELVMADPPSARDGRVVAVSQSRLEETRAMIDSMITSDANDRTSEPISPADPVLTD